MNWKVVLAITAALAISAHADDVEWTVAGKPVFETPITVSETSDAKEAVGSSLRICTYNIQDFSDGHGDGRERTEDIAIRHAGMAAGILAEISPDVVVLEEIEGSQAISQLNRSLDDPYPFVYITSFGHPRHDDRKLNIAVLSRLPLTGLKEIDFQEMEGAGRPPRGLLRFAISLEEKKYLLVYAVHLKSNWGDRERNEEKRRRAVEILRADARRVQARYPASEWEVMMIGDTNVDPDLPSFAEDPTFDPVSDWYDLWRGVPIAERTTVPTRHGDPMQEFPPASFDRIIVSPELKEKPWVVGEPKSLKRGVNTADVSATGGNGKHISDHYPVYVDISR
ncbi:MAG: endonuclease/exonuclease/phosphatase family protein [Verrucomicrobia bacterium]|nr:endonuclease/exonuclease/phosphatase family protein [Verrucomicrobiota bacterium]